MKKEFMFGIIILIFLVNIISAVDTEIKIKTLPNHEVQLTTHKTNTADFVIINQFKDNSNEYGDITFIANCDDETFNLIIYLKKDNEKVLANNFTNPYKESNLFAGEPIYIELAPSWFEFIETPNNETIIGETNSSENQTIQNLIDETEEQLEQEENKVKIAGSAISEDENLLSKKTLYYSMIVMILLIISFVIFTIMRKSRLSNKKSFDKENAQQIIGDVEREQKKKKQIMQDAQKKMREIEKDMEKLRDED